MSHPACCFKIAPKQFPRCLVSASQDIFCSILLLNYRSHFLLQSIHKENDILLFPEFAIQNKLDTCVLRKLAGFLETFTVMPRF